MQAHLKLGLVIRDFPCDHSFHGTFDESEFDGRYCYGDGGASAASHFIIDSDGLVDFVMHYNRA